MHEWYRRGWRALLVVLAVSAVHAQAQPQAGAAVSPVAVTTVDLYAAVVPVTEQSNAELRRGAGIGLREVLVRAAGHGDVVRSAALGDALGDAGRYLDQYRYERNTSTEPGAAPLLLQMRFAPNSVTQLLRGAGLPVWSGTRPTLQLWLATDQGGRRQLVDERSPLAPLLRAQAQRRGLALRLPADVRALPVDDVWQMDAVRGRAAALAGGGEVVVLGRIALPPAPACGGMWVVAGGAQPPQQVGGDTLDACLAAGIDRIADTLAQQYAAAAPAGGSGDVLLRVSGIDSFNTYAALLAYLKQVGMIKAASPVQMQGDTVLLRVQLDGGAEQLTRQLALDNRLGAAVDAAPTTEAGAATPVATTPAATPALNYRWLAGRG